MSGTIDPQKDQLLELIEGMLSANGFELVDLELHRGKRTIVRLFIDRAQTDESVNVSDCARVSRLLGPALEVEEIFAGAYVLEVSSPGVERPLRKPKDFIRFRGKPARITTREEVDQRTFFSGLIAEANEQSVTIEMNGEWIQIPYDMVSKANLEFDFGDARN